MNRQLVNAIVAACAAVSAGLSVPARAVDRTGEEIVKQQCAKCHETGASGAPRIDDRAAWIPRLKQGVDATVRSAARGHGAMPARGGLADLTDTELRAAVLYMIYPAAALARAAGAPARTAQDPNLRVAAGLEIYLGIVPAEAISTPEPKPKGSGYYHVNITLRDSETKAWVKDAQVEARVANPVAGGETKRLEPMTVHGDGSGAGSYGNYFRMTAQEHYTITVWVHRTPEARPVEARFDFKH